MPEMIRKKIKWATKRRKCGMRVWKTKWMVVPAKTGSPTGAPPPPKPERGKGEKTEKTEKKA